MTLAYAHGTQRYYTPASLEELFFLLDTDPDATIVCGGTDVSLRVTKRFETLGCGISVEGISGLRALSRDASGWTVGAAVTLTALHDATRAELPALDKMLRFFASRQLKNRGTLAAISATPRPSATWRR